MRIVSGSRYRRAVGERKAGNARLPVEPPIEGDVFRRVPERAAIDGIDGNVAVIPPTVQERCLRTGAGENQRFALHRSQWVGILAAGELNRGLAHAIGDALRHRNIANLVHSDSPHPAEASVRRIRTLLVHHRMPVPISNLLPTHTPLASLPPALLPY